MRIGLLASTSMSNFMLNALKPVFEDESMEVALVILDSKPKLTLKSKIKKNFKRGRGAYMLVMAAQSYCNKKKNSLNTKTFCSEKGIDFIETSDYYASKTIEKIKSYNLDILFLTGGFGIIKDPLLHVTPLGVLSYHHGNMRIYRGMPPGLWELYNNEKEMGVTIQILSASLDCGIPVVEKTIRIDRNDTVRTLQSKAFKESEEMLYKALKLLTSEAFRPIEITSVGKLYTLPNLKQWIFLQLKILYRRLRSF